MIKKVILSALAWLIVVLVCAATVEVATGVKMPGLVNMLTLLICAPIWWRIWRRASVV